MSRPVIPTSRVDAGASPLLVARWTARDAWRSRGLASALLVVGIVALAAVVLPAAVVGESLSAAGALAFLVAPLQVVVTLTGLLAGYGVVAGPRAGGQLTLLLSLPVDRTALVIGAFIGRAAVALGGVGTALAVVSVAIPVLYGGLPLGALAAFGGLLALLAVAVTGLAVGLSAAAGTPGRAAVAAIGAFVCFQFFWGVVPAGLYYLLEGSMPGPVVPAWVVLVERLQPLGTFAATADQVLPTVGDAVQLSPGGAEAAEAAGPPPLADRLDGPPPFYLDPWAGGATLVGWTIAPLAAGWYRFARADL